MNHRNKNIDNIRTSVISYWPLLAAYALAFMAATQSVKFNTAPDFMSHFMGFVLVVFGLFKLYDVEAFVKGFVQYDPIAKRFKIYGKMYPFVEILLGVMFIFQMFVLPSTIIALAIYSVSLYGVVKSLLKKEKLHCMCLGTYFKLPLSKITLIESLFMILMCLWMLVMIVQMRTMSM